MSVNSNTLIINPTTGRVGVGTAIPATALHIENIGSNSNILSCYTVFTGSYPPAAVTYSNLGTTYTGLTTSNFTLNAYYPPNAMTNSNVNLTGNLYGNGWYLAADSSRNGTILATGAYLAFDNNTSTCWLSGATLGTSSYSNNGGYSGTATTSNTGGSNTLGEWIQITMSNTIRLTSYTLTATLSNASTGYPRSYRVHGTNGLVTGAWTILDEVVNNVNTGAYNLAANTLSFSNYRLVVQTTTGGTQTASLSNKNAVAIHDWKLYDNTTTISTTLSNYAPTVVSTGATIASTDADYNTGTYSVSLSNHTHSNIYSVTIDSNAVPMTLVRSTTYNQADPSGVLDLTSASALSTNSAFTSNTDTSPPAYVILSYPSANLSNIPVSKYSITASSSTSEAPRKWEVHGSTNGSTWVTPALHSVSNVTWSASETKTYDLPTASSYPYYRFSFFQNNSATAAPVTISKILAFGYGRDAACSYTVSSRELASYGTYASYPSGKYFINADIQSPTFAGMVSFFARSTAPTGWLKCNGAAISRTTYAKLFAAIGTTHGVGNGSTTFNLPDLRGQFLRGYDDGAGVDAGRVFGSAQQDAVINHTHSGTTGNAGAHNHAFTVYAALAGGKYADWDGGVNNSSATRYTDTEPAHAHAFTTGNPNANGASENRPVNVALLACIKY